MDLYTIIGDHANTKSAFSKPVFLETENTKTVRKGKTGRKTHKTTKAAEKQQKGKLLDVKLIL